jgi:hypothetical protein
MLDGILPQVHRNFQAHDILHIIGKVRIQTMNYEIPRETYLTFTVIPRDNLRGLAIFRPTPSRTQL